MFQPKTMLAAVGLNGGQDAVLDHLRGALLGGIVAVDEEVAQVLAGIELVCLGEAL